MERWLVRTAQNQIQGPFSKEQLCQKILDGQVSFQDEVCPANGYWFYLHERQYVQEHLGVEVPKEPRKVDDEETTQVKDLTLTLSPDPHEEPTDPDLGRIWDMAQKKSRPAKVATEPEPVISAPLKSSSAGSSAILSETALKEIRSHRKTQAASAISQDTQQISIRGQTHSSAFRKRLGLLALILVLIALGAWYYLSFLKS
jgi:cobalamin biosynthesis Mg chelatase CobN